MTTTAPLTRAQVPDTVPRGGLTFGGILRSEWLKLFSLRSTWWSLGITVVFMVGLSALVAVSAGSVEDGLAGITGVQVATSGYLFAQLVVAVLGTLAISGEYATGQIRSTLAAVPTRLPVLAAKAIVLAATTLAVGVLAALAAAVVTAPLLPDTAAIDFADGETWRILLGSGLYLAAIALLGFGLGALIRHSAGAITAILGVVLLLPLVVTILGNWLSWVADLAPYLPAAAGERIMATESVEAIPGLTLLEPWTGYAILLAYVAVALTAAAVLLRRRDA